MVITIATSRMDKSYDESNGGNGYFPFANAEKGGEVLPSSNSLLSNNTAQNQWHNPKIINRSQKSKSNQTYTDHEQRDVQKLDIHSNYKEKYHKSGVL
jgi:hypothetical protein